MSKQDAELMREAALLITSCADDGLADRLRARANELDPPEQETEHWKKIGSTIALYERWPLLWHRDPVWVARAKHIAKIAAEGTVPVNVLDKLCATWENEAKEAIVVVGVAKKRAINDLREVLAGRSDGNR